MTTKTEWAHLPNARHIDAVLADVEARPEAWREARGAAQDVAKGAVRLTAGGEAQHAAWDAAFTAARGAARDVVWNAAVSTAQHAAWGAILTLIAWDSSADLLDLPPDVLRTMIDLAPEPVNYQAALLLPYAIVRAAP